MDNASRWIWLVATHKIYLASLPLSLEQINIWLHFSDSVEINQRKWLDFMHQCYGEDIHLMRWAFNHYYL